MAETCDCCQGITDGCLVSGSEGRQTSLGTHSPHPAGSHSPRPQWLLKHDVPYLRSSPQFPSARSLLFCPLPINILLLSKVRGQLPDPQQGRGLSALVLMVEFWSQGDRLPELPIGAMTLVVEPTLSEAREHWDPQQMFETLKIKVK